MKHGVGAHGDAHPTEGRGAPNLPQRRHLRRLDRIVDTSRAPLFYVTTCAEHRAPVLARPEVSRILVEAWRDARGLYGWLVGRYVVMPDHAHFFAAPAAGDAKSLSEFVGLWKRWTARLIRQAGIRGFAWQREFFDHLLRSQESYEQKWEYVRNNAVRKRLVVRPEEWPYQGEIHVLRW